MKTKKMIIAVLFCFSLINYNFSEYVNASTIDDIITFEEYSNTIIDAYSSENIQIEIIKPEHDITLTRAILNNDLQHVNENVEKIKSLSTIDNNAIEADVVWNTNPISRAMYGEATGTATYYGTDTSNALIPLSYTIRVTATIYGDINNCTILRAYQPSLNLISATGYDDYIKLLSYSSSIDNSSSTIANHCVYYTITCELKQVINIGAVTSWTKVNKTFPVTIKPFK